MGAYGLRKRDLSLLQWLPEIEGIESSECQAEERESVTRLAACGFVSVEDDAAGQWTAMITARGRAAARWTKKR